MNPGDRRAARRRSRASSPRRPPPTPRSRSRSRGGVVACLTYELGVEVAPRRIPHAGAGMLAVAAPLRSAARLRSTAGPVRGPGARARRHARAMARAPVGSAAALRARARRIAAGGRPVRGALPRRRPSHPRLPRGGRLLPGEPDAAVHGAPWPDRRGPSSPAGPRPSGALLGLSRPAAMPSSSPTRPSCCCAAAASRVTTRPIKGTRPARRGRRVRRRARRRAA